MSLSLYIHIPFCRAKCPYCDFTSGYKPDKEILANYTAALCREIRLFQNSYSIKEPISTVYFGGGTPSLLTNEQLNTIIIELNNNFNIKSDENTLEVNPEDVTNDRVYKWQETGFNRISLGFQSMENPILKFLGRSNNKDQNILSLALLKEAGFKNISIDLITSIKGEDIESTLQSVSELKPAHISIYQLTIEEKTLLYQKVKKMEYVPMTDNEILNNYWNINRSLKKQGYLYYEISNYALSAKYFSKHNLNYWNYGPYIGLGLGASGFMYCLKEDFHGKRWTNTIVLKDYIKKVEENILPVGFTEEIDKKTASREYIMLGLRKTEGIYFKDFNRIFQLDFFKAVSPTALKNISPYLKINSEKIKLKRKGINIANKIIQELWK